ncbi:LexA family transcriptional regulator [Undibacterium sp. TJN25]|uniref:LexA family transcriptional regulator n=1 Tax=Undibacterium sp. TJN25 TaxID=3413056 RepID=UPI003BEF8A20
MTLTSRLETAMQAAGFASQSALSRASGVPQPTINRILNAVGTKGPETETLRKLASACNVSFEWLHEGLGSMQRGSAAEDSAQVRQPHMRINAGNSGDEGAGAIRFMHASGSCGGGFNNYEDLEKEPLIKEERWFSRFHVKRDDVVAIYAYGDSMADFIIDGDIVIFDTKKTEITSGQIYAIDSPDGLRIKRVHRRADGSLVLTSDNPNKNRYPDELYTPEQSAQLVVKGKFVYRQGGY